MESIVDALGTTVLSGSNYNIDEGGPTQDEIDLERLREIDALIDSCQVDELPALLKEVKLIVANQSLDIRPVVKFGAPLRDRISSKIKEL
ncbi:hypothetical protein KC678_03335 [Candidatus Dojkabacteria bacterium]|uniref:Uncharacterized protein n=1 Tax=Candidatus Dojkabacteria bacterium TaxID=2099670 RepID=A0A955L1R4_9BACT|nr:hypothetical protein [Candidatus Dojkabacteria bacterium]